MQCGMRLVRLCSCKNIKTFTVLFNRASRLTTTTLLRQGLYKGMEAERKFIWIQLTMHGRTLSLRDGVQHRVICAMCLPAFLFWLLSHFSLFQARQEVPQVNSAIEATESTLPRCRSVCGMDCPRRHLHSGWKGALCLETRRRLLAISVAILLLHKRLHHVISPWLSLLCSPPLSRIVCYVYIRFDIVLFVIGVTQGGMVRSLFNRHLVKETSMTPTSLTPKSSQSSMVRGMGAWVVGGSSL